MPDTDVAEKVAPDATLESPTGSVAAQPQITDAPPGEVEAAEPTAAEEKASAPVKPSREEQLERELRVSRGDQAAMRKELNALKAAGDPEARKIARTADVKAARAEALALGQDEDKAESAVRKEHADADIEAATTLREQQSKARWDQATAEMGEALKAVGLAWEAPELSDVREDWQGYWDEGRVTDARRLVRQVKAIKKAESVLVKEGSPPRRTAQQRSRDMDDDGGPSGGSRPTATSENIDRLFMEYERQYPDRPNPYAAQYRELLNS